MTRNAPEVEKELNMTAGDNQLTQALLRERAGLTQRQLADALGVTMTTIGSWERGVKEPRLSFANVKRPIEVLQCSLDQLVEATEERPSK